MGTCGNAISSSGDTLGAPRAKYESVHARIESDDVALSCGLFASADRAVLADFLDVTIGPLTARNDFDELLAAVTSEARHRSARAASTALGVLPRTVAQRRRRALEASGLADDPHDRLLLTTAVLAFERTSST
jgi:hypothetical protein